MCHIPDPCLKRPCASTAYCIRNTTRLELFSCACVEGAFGVPGPLGAGCVIPSLAVIGQGQIAFAVAAAYDVKFRVGSSEFSVLGIDGAIDGITLDGGAIDSKVSEGVASLFALVDEQIDDANTLTVSILTSTIAARVATASTTTAGDATARQSTATATAANDANNKANSALSTANQNANAFVSTARAQTLSQSQIYDSATLSTAIANTDSVRVSLASQIAGLLSWGIDCFTCL